MVGGAAMPQPNFTDNPNPAPPAAAREALDALILAARARSLALYAVGGCVRDLLLERPILDLDLTPEGDAPPARPPPPPAAPPLGGPRGLPLGATDAPLAAARYPLSGYDQRPPPPRRAPARAPRAAAGTHPPAAAWAGRAGGGPPVPVLRRAAPPRPRAPRGGAAPGRPP